MAGPAEDPYLQLSEREISKRNAIFELRELECKDQAMAQLSRCLNNAAPTKTTLVNLRRFVDNMSLSLSSQKAELWERFP